MPSRGSDLDQRKNTHDLYLDERIIANELIERGRQEEIGFCQGSSLAEISSSSAFMISLRFL